MRQRPTRAQNRFHLIWSPEARLQKRPFSYRFWKAALFFKFCSVYITNRCENGFKTQTISMRDNETKMTSCLAKLRTTLFGLDFKINVTSGPLSSRNFQERNHFAKRVSHTLWKPNTLQPKFTTNGELKWVSNNQLQLTFPISKFCRMRR